jgi:hypothetical protein
MSTNPYDKQYDALSLIPELILVFTGNEQGKPRHVLHSGFIPSDVVFTLDRLCSLVVIVPGYRFRGLGSIPGASTFSE